MPLTFEDAKFQYNSDPDWQPKRDSKEYHDIITLMKQSGATFHTPTNRPLEIKDVYKDGGFKHPINNIKPPIEKQYISKKAFLSVSSNKRDFLNALIPKETIVVESPPETIISKETLKALKTQSVSNQRLSKKEFLTMEDNREYIRQHILINKK